MYSLSDITIKLTNGLSGTLPGQDAHDLMAVPGRGKYPIVPEQAKRAAVLIFLYEKVDRVFVALIKRETHEKDRHSGQISFPGGSMEVSDDYPIQTALREAHEEIGIPMDIQILGALTPLYIPVSGFFVSPVIASYPSPIPFSAQATEVKEILEVDLSMLLKTEAKSKREIKISSGLTLKEVPCYEIHGTIIWGATAMILAELEWLLRK